MTFGRETDEKTAGKILNRFIEVGGNFLDTRMFTRRVRRKKFSDELSASGEKI